MNHHHTYYLLAALTGLGCASPGTGEQGHFELLVSSTIDNQLRPLAAGFSIPLTLHELGEVDVDAVASLRASNPEVLSADGLPQLSMRDNGDRQTFFVTTFAAGPTRLTALDEAGNELDSFVLEVAEPSTLAVFDSGSAPVKSVSLKPGEQKLLRARVLDARKRELVTGRTPGDFQVSADDESVASVAEDVRCAECRPAFPQSPELRVTASTVGETGLRVALTARPIVTEVKVDVAP